MTTPFVSACCQGERCFCGAPAEHKVEEVIFFDDPMPRRHPLTSYICHRHFRELMRPNKSPRQNWLVRWLDRITPTSHG